MECIFCPPFPAKQARMLIKQELQIAVQVHHCTRELHFKHIMHVHVWLILGRLDSKREANSYILGWCNLPKSEEVEGSRPVHGPLCEAPAQPVQPSSLVGGVHSTIQPVGGDSFCVLQPFYRHRCPEGAGIFPDPQL